MAKGILVCVVLAIVTFAVYGRVLDNDFFDVDDPAYITNNTNINAGLSLRSVRWAFSGGHFANYHPLTWLSHIVDCQLFELNPKWHHLVNLLFHITNTVLLFWVLKDMTGGLWQSVFVAAAFALHPLHVESVVWVAERKDVLSTMFWLLTMTAYLRYVRYSGAKWYLVTLFLFALGLLAKPMLVSLPFVLLLLDYWPLNRLQNTRDIKNLVVEKVPFFVLSIISSVVTFLVQRSAGAMFDIEVLPLHIRAANTAVSYLRYIGKMIWPNRLAVFYPYHKNELSIWQVVGAALLLVIVSVLVIRLASKRGYLPMGWFWYLGTLVPVIGLVQVGSQAMADRYTYITLTGLFIIIAWGLNDLLAGRRYKEIILGVPALTALLALSICTWNQLHYWRNSIALFEHTLAVTSNNNMTLNNLANTLASCGKYEEAIKYQLEAVRLNPDYAEGHNNLGFILQSQGKLDEAIACYREAIRINPDYVVTYQNLGTALYSQGKLDEAIKSYYQALAVKPDYMEAHYNLGLALVSEGKLSEATEHFRKALQIKPDDAEIHNNLGSALLEQGKLDEAISHYRQAVRLKPDNENFRLNLDKAIRLSGTVR